MTRPIGVELFCGVGGMSLGFEMAGFHVVAAIDSDPINVEYHKKNFPRTLTLREDVSTLSGQHIREKAELGDRTIDVLFGGPPCQGFSEIGQRRNGDARNLLVLDFARLVRELRPRYFVLENVRGLLYGHAKPVLDSFLLRVRRAGYNVVTPIQTLDASKFGVPQKRQRVFLLGYRKGLAALQYPQPLLRDGKVVPPPTVRDAIGDFPNLLKYDSLLRSDRFGGRLSKPSDYARALRGGAKRSNGLAYSRERPNALLGGCLRTAHTADTIERFQATLPGTYEPSSRCYRLALDGIAPTLRAGTLPAFGSFTAARPIHPTQPRYITTREAARLHSFPDWFEFHPTKWRGFMQIGNAVPPRLAWAWDCPAFS